MLVHEQPNTGVAVGRVGLLGLRARRFGNPEQQLDHRCASSALATSRAPFPLRARASARAWTIVARRGSATFMISCISLFDELAHRSVGELIGEAEGALSACLRDLGAESAGCRRSVPRSHVTCARGGSARRADARGAVHEPVRVREKARHGGLERVVGEMDRNLGDRLAHLRARVVDVAKERAREGADVCALDHVGDEVAARLLDCLDERIHVFGLERIQECLCLHDVTRSLRSSSSRSSSRRQGGVLRTPLRPPRASSRIHGVIFSTRPDSSTFPLAPSEETTTSCCDPDRIGTFAWCVTKMNWRFPSSAAMRGRTTLHMKSGSMLSSGWSMRSVQSPMRRRIREDRPAPLAGGALDGVFPELAVLHLDDRLVVDADRLDGVEARRRGEHGDNLARAVRRLLEVCLLDRAGDVVAADDRDELVGADPRDAVDEPLGLVIRDFGERRAQRRR